MPTCLLPDEPSFEHLRREARRLHRQVHAGDAEALAAVREFHPRAESALARFLLSDAQLATARGYGFTSWAAIKQHLARIAPFVWNPRSECAPPRRHDAARSRSG